MKGTYLVIVFVVIKRFVSVKSSKWNFPHSLCLEKLRSENMEIKKSSQYPTAKNLNKKWQKFDTRQKKIGQISGWKVEIRLKLLNKKKTKKRRKLALCQKMNTADFYDNNSKCSRDSSFYIISIRKGGFSVQKQR